MPYLESKTEKIKINQSGTEKSCDLFIGKSLKYCPVFY